MSDRTDAGERLSTGVAGLDRILGGGLVRDRAYLLEGQPGTGKTTLGMQFLLAGAEQGERALLITHSETEQEIQDIARSHGWDLTSLHVHEWRNAGDVEPQDYTLFHVGDLELGDAMRNLLDEVVRVRPRRLVLDSLVGLRMLAAEAAAYRRQIQVLRRFLMEHSCTVLLIDEGPEDLRAQTIVHGVIQLQNIAQQFGPERRQLRVMKMRGVQYTGGFHDFQILRGGLDVYPRLVAKAHERRYPAEEVSTGNPELDRMLGGGLYRGTGTLVVGPAGCGKSTMLGACAVAAARRGEKALVLLFDETVEVWEARLGSLGIDPAPWIRSGHLTVKRLDPAQISPGWLSTEAQRVVEEGVSMVMLDSINGFLQAMAEERHVAMHLRELLTYLDTTGVATLLTLSQHGMLGAGQITPIDVSYLADSVILLRFFEAAGEIRQAISVVKKRTGRHERTIREMRIGRGGLQIGEPLRDFAGVLSGTPTFGGSVTHLMDREEPDREQGT